MEFYKSVNVCCHLRRKFLCVLIIRLLLKCLASSIAINSTTTTRAHTHTHAPLRGAVCVFHAVPSPRIFHFTQLHSHSVNLKWNRDCGSNCVDPIGRCNMAANCQRKISPLSVLHAIWSTFKCTSHRYVSPYRIALLANQSLANASVIFPLRLNFNREPIWCLILRHCSPPK